ncbi:putative ATP-dependent helicase C23E6.02 [Gossypium arboreum]|uniref:Putative ATP-dependent helicase C23E6.02 n=1 Tax=Gossypium arboreum TaxID=29729 RepID=A0A0B0PYA7_GOSAR|nr:putative ATP-dependent helicase C23E6.02 [Gossypium arboreum]
MASTNPIDISSSDSELEIEDDEDKITSSLRPLPEWAVKHGTNSRGHARLSQTIPSPSQTQISNLNPSNVNNHAQIKIPRHEPNDNVKASTVVIALDDDPEYFTGNGNIGQPWTVNSRIANGFGTDFEKLTSQQALKRTLPPSLQLSGPSSKPYILIDNVSSNLIRDSHGSSNLLAGPRFSNCQGYIGEHYSRGDSNEIMMYGNTSRILPPTLMHGKSVNHTQIAGPDGHAYRAGVSEERFSVNDERMVYQAALEDLNQPKVEATFPDGLLSVPLLRHQKIALDWMLQRETKSVYCMGGILADDQGLGKTISMIALIQMQKAVSKRRLSAGTLVVCPASILRQWARELEDKVPEESKLSVLIYHGGSRTKDPSEFAKYDVVLTTYSIITNEVPKQPIVDDDEIDEKIGERYGLSSEFSINKKRKRASHVGMKMKKGKKGIDSSTIDPSAGALAKPAWFRVILDEAQTIKNHRTQVARACCSLRAKRRWCLSGTPIQNAIDDLYSYFRFLKYEPYSVYTAFCHGIKGSIAKDYVKGYKKLQAILKVVMLRRTKATLIDGEPIIKLPPKSVLMSKVDFTAEERDFYTQLEADSRSQFKAYAAAGTVNQNYANILLMLLRLRQACDHPLLVQGFDSDSIRKSDSVGQVSVEMAKSLPREMLINLVNCLEASAICLVCKDPPDDPVVTMCCHVFCYQCVSEHLTGDDNTCPARGCKEQLGADIVFSRSTLRICIADGHNGSLVHPQFENSVILQDEYSSSKIKTVIEILKSKCLLKNSSLESQSAIGCSETSLSSEQTYTETDHSGIRVVKRTTVYSNSLADRPMKAIVFSQWTRMLDLVEHSLRTHSINYRRLDGTMSLAARDRNVKDFNNDPEVTVMLMSLKAGNLGLNMVAACHVILLDLWWNPTTEDQAIDRAHRIGQTRPVTVTRITIKDTVEDRILSLQEEKRKMVASAFGEDQSGSSATRLTVEDLRYLFMGD